MKRNTVNCPIRPFQADLLEHPQQRTCSLHAHLLLLADINIVIAIAFIAAVAVFFDSDLLSRVVDPNGCVICDQDNLQTGEPVDQTTICRSWSRA